MFQDIINYLENNFESDIQITPYINVDIYHRDGKWQLIQHLQADTLSDERMRVKEEFSANGTNRSWYYADTEEFLQYLKSQKGEKRPVTYQKYLGLKAHYYHEEHGRRK